VYKVTVDIRFGLWINTDQLLITYPAFVR